MKNKKTIAIVPGSFDPITYGHIDIAKRAAKKYDVVYLAVMINSQKNYMFNIGQREEIARSALSGVNNIIVISSEGMLWELAKELCADAIVKGYRNNADYEYEMKMARFNSEHYPNAKTILLEADETLDQLSSTVVRQKIKNNESLVGCLPSQTIDIVNKILSQK